MVLGLTCTNNRLKTDYLCKAPKTTAPETMNMHNGTTVLEFKKEDVLEGNYYTGRGRTTHGAVRLIRAKLP